MTANELRISNFAYNVGMSEFQITPHELALMFRHEMNKGEYKDILPIPLTEEWLLKHWKRSYMSNNYSKDYKWIIEIKQGQYEYLVACNNDDSISFYHEGEIHGYCVAIEYIHDLQNQFYFNSDKTELII
jgi:hypothetical protein